MPLKRQHHFARGGERILSGRHRHGTGVSGQSGDDAADTARTRDRGHHPERQAGIEQHRALFDMRLDECDHALVASIDTGHCLRVAAKLAQGIAHREAIGIGRIEPCRIERTRHRLAADQRDTEAHPFLVAEGHHLDGHRQPNATPVQVGHAGDRREDAEQAVIAAGVAHAIEVRAGHEHWCIGDSALVATHHIAKRVPMNRHAGLTHPGRDQFTCLPMLGGEVGAGEARCVLGDGGELLGARQDRIAEATGRGAHRAGAG